MIPGAMAALSAGSKLLGGGKKGDGPSSATSGVRSFSTGNWGPQGSKVDWKIMALIAVACIIIIKKVK